VSQRHPIGVIPGCDHPERVMPAHPASCHRRGMRLPHGDGGETRAADGPVGPRLPAAKLLREAAADPPGGG